MVPTMLHIIPTNTTLTLLRVNLEHYRKKGYTYSTS